MQLHRYISPAVLKAVVHSFRLYKRWRYLFRWDLHAHVTTCNHDRVCLCQDLIVVLLCGSVAAAAVANIVAPVSKAKVRRTTAAVSSLHVLP
jgi:hypothetical protein